MIKHNIKRKAKGSRLELCRLLDQRLGRRPPQERSRLHRLVRPASCADAQITSIPSGVRLSQVYRRAAKRKMAQVIGFYTCYDSYSLCTAPALEDSSKSVHPPGLKSRSLELIVCSPSSASTLLLFDHNQDSMRFQAHQSRSMSGFDTPGWSTRLLLD